MKSIIIIFFSTLIINTFTLSISFAEVIIQPIEPYSSEMDIHNNETLKELTISTAKNEIESASFYIKNTSSKPIKINIEVSNLTSNDSVVSKSSIDVKYVIEWYQSNGTWQTHRQTKKDKYKPVLVRELLVKNPELILVDKEKESNSILTGVKNKKYVDISKNTIKTKEPIEVDADSFYIEDTEQLKPVNINAGQTIQVWLTFKPFYNLQPGTYKGTVILKENDNVIKTQELNLVIHDFILAEPKQIYSIYYRGYLSKNGSISSESKSEKQLKAEFVDMLEHGICCPSVYQRILPKNSKLSRSELINLFDKYLRIRGLSGISNQTIYYLGLQTGGQKKKKEIDGLNNGLVELKKLLDKHGTTDIYIYGKEEVKEEQLISQLPLWTDTKSRGFKVFVAGYQGFLDTVQNAADVLVYYDKIEPNIAAKAHSYNTKVFSYSQPQVGVENPSIYRKNYGFSMIAANFDGVMDYAYQHSMGFIWNDFDNEVYRDHVFAYPTSTGVIDTLAWEGFREAVDDARYYATAVDRIVQKKGPAGEVELHDWLLSQCSAHNCNSENIRNDLIKIIEEN